MAVTLREVALRAGVSRSAVSRAFTPGASVSAKTRAAIAKAVSGFWPDAVQQECLVHVERVVCAKLSYKHKRGFVEMMNVLRGVQGEVGQFRVEQGTLNADALYAAAFAKIFKSPATEKTLAAAIAELQANALTTEEHAYLRRKKDADDNAAWLCQTIRSNAPSVALMIPAPTRSTSVLMTALSDIGLGYFRDRSAGELG